MRRWRRLALILAVAAFVVAGAGPPTWIPDGVLPQAGRMACFWAGVVCFLLAVWGRGGT
jgi:hypothetical protein